MRDQGEVASLRGARVGEVATLGKHLLVVIGHPGHPASEDRVLHVHLGMRGRWRRTDPSTPERARAQLSLETDADRFSCARAAVVECLRRRDVRDHPRLSRLGPDLLRVPFPLDELVRRARSRASRSVAELLLDQGVACGLGNAFKSDVLFLEGVHPETPPHELSDAALRGLFSRAHELMRWNRLAGRRITTRRPSTDAPLARGEPAHWVYERAREPCLRCGTPISSARVGDAARVTFWCGRCQPALSSRGAGGRAAGRYTRARPEVP